MTTQYLTAADTAKLVRKALKEAFPDMKFSVRSHTYSGGASLTVAWTDGPNIKQVEAVTCRFQGSYFDGQIDYKGSIYHLVGASPSPSAPIASTAGVRSRMRPSSKVLTAFSASTR